jgi:hypothetical protein
MIAKYETCGAPEYTRGACNWLHIDDTPTTTARKTTTVTLSPAGDYIFWARNGGSTEETVAYEVYLRP